MNGGDLANEITVGVVTNYWDGGGPASNGSIDGGAGTWNAANYNWANSSGAFSGAWATGRLANFGGTTGGAVTLASTSDIEGLSFTTTGYSISTSNSSVLNNSSGGRAPGLLFPCPSPAESHRLDSAFHAVLRTGRCWHGGA